VQYNTAKVGSTAAAMNKSDVLRYKNLLLAKQQELSTRKSLINSIASSAEAGRDVVDVAASETGAAK